MAKTEITKILPSGFYDTSESPQKESVLERLAVRGIAGLLKIRPDLDPRKSMEKERGLSGPGATDFLNGAVAAAIMSGATSKMLAGDSAAEHYGRVHTNFREFAVKLLVAKMADSYACAAEEKSNQHLQAMSPADRNSLEDFAVSLGVTPIGAASLKESMLLTFNRATKSFPMIDGTESPPDAKLREMRAQWTSDAEAKVLDLIDKPIQAILDAGFIIQAPLAGLGKVMRLIKREQGIDS